jgi:hypothetical protein
MKTPRPWYRKQDDTWYICRQGKQIPLCKGKDNKAEAERVFFQVMARDGAELPEPSTLRLAQVCDLFLDWSSRHNEPRTYGWYKDFLQDFCDLYGGTAPSDLFPKLPALMKSGRDADNTNTVRMYTTRSQGGQALWPPTTTPDPDWLPTCSPRNDLCGWMPPHPWANLARRPVRQCRR